MSNGVVSGGFSLPCAVLMHGTGYRTGQDGLTSGFFNIIIVADPSKLLDHEIGTLGDYIAMMALSQPSSLDSCQDLPSISNLLAKGCASVPASITDGDLAFLKGLYTAKGYEMTIQHDAIRYQMRKALVTDKGGANYRAIPTTRCATLRASMRRMCGKFPAMAWPSVVSCFLLARR
ncbi:MAG: hypothetical protein ACRD5Z_26745 [Bryobacteraceae bacterium]